MSTYQFDLNKVIEGYNLRDITDLQSQEEVIGRETENCERNGDHRNVILHAIELLAVQHLLYKKSSSFVVDPHDLRSSDNMLLAGVCYMKAKTSFGILIYKIISENLLEGSDEENILLESLKTFHSTHWDYDKIYLEGALRDGRYTPPSAENDFVNQKTTFKNALRVLFPGTDGELPAEKTKSGCLLLIPQLTLTSIGIGWLVDLFV